MLRFAQNRFCKGGGVATQYLRRPISVQVLFSSPEIVSWSSLARDQDNASGGEDEDDADSKAHGD